MSRVAHLFHQLDVTIFNSPRIVLSFILTLTVFFGLQIPGVLMYSDFADQLPQSHPYIQLHNEIKDNFGGANVIIVGIEVKEGEKEARKNKY